MNPGDGLHHPAITVAKAEAVDSFHLADVGTAVLRHRHFMIAVDGARHAVYPQHFVIQIAVNKAVNLFHGGEQFRHAGQWRCDHLQQRFRIIGSDARMSQRRTQGHGVRSLRQLALRVDPQALLFKAALDSGQQQAVLRGGQDPQGLIEVGHKASWCW